MKRRNFHTFHLLLPPAHSLSIICLDRTRTICWINRSKSLQMFLNVCLIEFEDSRSPFLYFCFSAQLSVLFTTVMLSSSALLLHVSPSSFTALSISYLEGALPQVSQKNITHEAKDVCGGKNPPLDSAQTERHERKSSMFNSFCLTEEFVKGVQQYRRLVVFHGARTQGSSSKSSDQSKCQ